MITEKEFIEKAKSLYYLECQEKSCDHFDNCNNCPKSNVSEIVMQLASWIKENSLKGSFVDDTTKDTDIELRIIESMHDLPSYLKKLLIMNSAEKTDEVLTYYKSVFNATSRIIYATSYCKNLQELRESINKSKYSLTRAMLVDAIIYDDKIIKNRYGYINDELINYQSKL